MVIVLRYESQRAMFGLSLRVIDILYLHWWDHTISIEEIMDPLYILVQQGKVLYLGIMDSPNNNSPTT
jgi:aryl-alcohol dehydrogenase-like predicted oxidoreductase